MPNRTIQVPDELLPSAEVSFVGARAVAEFLQRMIPTHCPQGEVHHWEGVMNALSAIINDTFAIILEEDNAPSV